MSFPRKRESRTEKQYEIGEIMSSQERIERLLKFTDGLRELSADKKECELAKQAIFATVESEETKK